MGYMVEHMAIRPDPVKVDMLIKAKSPESVEDLKSFLGLVQFYKGMLPHLAHAAHPLYAATTDKLKFQWTEKLEEAYRAVKSMMEKDIMQSELVGETEVQVMVDASKNAVCVVLKQGNRLIFCASKVLNDAQRRWSTIERELFAASWGIKKIRSYIYGINFELLTDHKPLVGLLGKQGEAPNSRIQIMLLSLAEYDFEIKHIPGIRNVIADYGTRQIKVTEWDKPTADDPEGLHELMVMEEGENMFSTKQMGEKDREQLRKMSMDTRDERGVLLVKHMGKEYVWIPHCNRRALFWELHSKLHEGITKMLEKLREERIYWPNADKEIREFLSQCVCTIKKDDKPTQKKCGSQQNIWISTSHSGNRSVYIQRRRISYSNMHFFDIQLGKKGKK